MIFSRAFKYICIGIPRTGSKSMIAWLRNYQDEWIDGHHEWRVPEGLQDELQDFLVFTVVRNPYDRAMSGFFADLWCGDGNESKQWESFAHYMGSLSDKARKDADGDGRFMNQGNYVKNGRASLVLYFERLPECLGELPFVDAGNIPLLPHAKERGNRPPGDFFDNFTAKDERLVWEYARENFEVLGYERFSCGLPEGSNNCLRLTPDSAAAKRR